VSLFIRPLTDWTGDAMRGEDYQFLFAARGNGGEIRLAYVSGALQAWGPLPEGDSSDHRIWHPCEFEEGAWRHLALTWSAAADELVLYLDGREISRAHYDAGMQQGEFLEVGCYGSGLQPAAILDEVIIHDRALTADEIATMAAPVR